MNSLEDFNHHRPLLFSIAYRMLGTVTDAEDMVQETFLRWQQTASETVRSAKTYLTSIITHLCIDHMRSARVRREQYVGTWLPEPMLTQESGNPADLLELADSLSIAFLMVLEQLSPIERAVFLLRDVFDYDYDEISPMVGKSPTNCRQILKRAKQHLTAQRPRFPVSQQQQAQITTQFLDASTNGDLPDLLLLLAKDVTFLSDGGGEVVATIKPIHGAAKIARMLLAIRRKWLFNSVSHLAEINGQAGIVRYLNGNIYSATTLEIVDGYIHSIYCVRNPQKLERIYQELSLK